MRLRFVKWAARAPRLATAIAFAAMSPSSACSSVPCLDRRHDTGLLLVCPEQTKDVPEAFKAAASDATLLAEEHPDDFGYPWTNADAREVEVRVTGPRGEAAAVEWIGGDAKLTSGRPTDIPRPSVSVKLVTVDRSVRRLTEIQHGSIPASDLPDGDAIWSTGPDLRRNATFITIDHLSEPLLRALASRYGTSAIVIRVEPNPHVRVL